MGNTNQRNRMLTRKKLKRWYPGGHEATELGSHTPPCHKRMVITTQFNVLPCCTAAQTNSVPLRVAFDCALAVWAFGLARTHNPPTALVSL